MPRLTLPLTDREISSAKPKEKQYALFDGKGLLLLVMPQGGKLWRFKYSFSGKQRLLSMGPYPEVSLANARERRDAARKQIVNGIDPGAARKAQKQVITDATETFEVIAREWHSKFSPNLSTGHATKLMSALQRDLFPWLGLRPIKDLKAFELLKTLRRIEERGALETAHRMRGLLGQIFRYAVATGRAERDPAVDLRGALPQPNERHLSAITDPKEVAHLLRAIGGYDGFFIVRCALRLAPMFFVRPGELRHAEWSEFDLDEASWNIPGSKMKMKEAHLVPLSRQAVEILKELQPLTGSGRFLFPSARSFSRPMSENTVNAALRRMGYTKDVMTGHGFRAMARTILDEVLLQRPELIEHQLAHAVRDPLGRAYNRTAHLTERRAMMQKWADYLDGLREGAVVLPMKARQ